MIAAALAAACAGSPPDALAPCPEPGPRPATAAPAPPPGDAGRGAAIFQAECARCHAPRVADRSSRLFRAYPRLDCPAWLDGVSDAWLGEVVTRGGEALGLDKAMKPFGDRLSAAEIADVVAALRALR